jgi:hypothetical protein
MQFGIMGMDTCKAGRKLSGWELAEPLPTKLLAKGAVAGKALKVEGAITLP